MNKTAARHLAARLASGLTHPGDEHNKPTPMPLPGLSTTTIPPEMAAEFANQAGLPHSDAATLVAEAIIACIEETHTIIDTTQLKELQQTAAETPTGTRLVTLHCRNCDTTKTNPLLQLAIGNNNQIPVNGPTLINALNNKTPQCPHTRTTP